MKKFCKFLIAFILCFIFVGTAEARYSAIYTNERWREYNDEPEPLVKFIVIEEGDGVVIRPLVTFEVGGEKMTPADTWNIDDVIAIRSEDGENIEDDDNRKYKSDDYSRFLHYQVNSGRNKFYFSNQFLLDFDYDIRLEKVEGLGPSAQTEPNAILDEMYCNYGPGEGQKIGEQSFVTFHMKREGSVIKYNIYIDHQKFFPEDIVLTHSYTGSNGLTVYETTETKFITVSAGVLTHSKNYDINTRRTMLDHVNPNNFWNMETGIYKCPEKASIGIITNVVSSPGGAWLWQKGERNITQDIEIAWDEQQFIYKYDNDITYTSDFLWWDIPIGEKASTVRNLVLYEDASYIDYEIGGSPGSKICLYYKTSEEYEQNGKPDSDVWNFALQEIPTFGGGNEYIFYEKDGGKENKFDDVYFNIASGKLDETCLDYVYTNCLNGDRSANFYTTGTYVGGATGSGTYVKLEKNKCIVSESHFAGSEKIATNEYLNEQDNGWVEDLISEETGRRYRQYVCDLKLKLNEFTTQDKLRLTSSLAIYNHKSEHLGDYNILDLPCKEWDTESNFTCTTQECKNDLTYTVNNQLKKILYYCEDIYKGILEEDANGTLLMGRQSECTSFKTFYKSLISNEIIEDDLKGCDILSNDLKDKLVWVLNVFKIAGPIMAVILGMIDFTKVLVSGEADKEMSSAWKRFKTRLIAAALLFIIPMILSMLINIFIGDEIDNNPYCDLFEETTK